MWNPDNTYLQVSDFGNRTRAAKLVVKKLTTRPTRHQTFDTNLHGVAVILPTNDREILGSTNIKFLIL